MHDSFISAAALRLITEAWTTAMEAATTEEELGEATECVVAGALCFFQRLSGTPFIREPTHEFEALTFRTPESGRIFSTLQLHFTLAESAIYIQAPEESPLDDMYHVRLTIAEASLPEFA